MLHPTLAADCHVLGRWRDLRILLHKDAAVRWVLLVPETSVTEWHELSNFLHDQLHMASCAVSAMFKAELKCDKINVAAIGNLVPQLHWHVVGRWKTDPYWPGVVWGRSTPGAEYAAREIALLSQGCLDACSHSSGERFSERVIFVPARST